MSISKSYHCDRDDFIYADPPYDVQFTSYSKENFGWDDQVRLAQWLARHPGPVVLSNQATDRIRELYKDLGYTVRTLTAPRMINSTGDRTPAKEVLALEIVASVASQKYQPESSPNYF